MTRLYLASTSPRRRELMHAAGLEFTLLRPAPDPPAPPTSSNPARLAIAHARYKALSALKTDPTCAGTMPGPGPARRNPATGPADRQPRGLIVGADTIVVLGRRVLGKPRDPAQARQMLWALSGRTHRVVSGLAVHDTASRRTRTAAEETRVTFRRLGPAEIRLYLESGEPIDKAGAYGIQGRAAGFVARLQGSYLNVVGLPLARLLLLLRTALVP